MVPLTYIQSDGNQYIDTGIYGNNNINFEVEIEFPSQLSYIWRGLFGAGVNIVQSYLVAINGMQEATIQCGSNNWYNATYGFQTNTRYVIGFIDRTLVINNVNIRTLTDQTFTTLNTMHLLHSNGNSVVAAIPVKLYRAKIWDENNILVRDYIPVLDNNNVPCLYDNVSGTFFYNIGSGAFTPGDPIVPPIPTYTIAFNANSGSGTMPNQTAEVDNYVTLNTCTFVREGYTFIGWSTSSTGSVTYADGDTVYNLAHEGETVTLYAVWRKNPPYLIIQENKSETINLTKELVDILQTPFTLKEETSIIDPVFVINCPIDLLFRANYITAPSLGRKYFIQDIVSMTNDLVELTCHVDVLSTYASEIRANKGIIFRQQNDWNLYLNDGVIQAYQNPIVTTQKFPKGFTQQNYVLVCAGSRNIGGVVIGDGGSIDTTYPEEAGGGNLDSKTTSGLVNYCKAQVGKPYWYGTFGQTATADLLDWRRADYEAYYPDPGSPPFVDQIGQRVHDCVGLIKGYRWSQTPNAVPQYVAAQDVDVKGLWSQCNKLHGNVDFSYTSTLHLIGMCVFDASLTHVGVYIGNGRIIEAQGHAYGVVNNDAYARRAKFTLWGVPDWLKITTAPG